MQKWEYMIQSHKYTEAELNEVGREGWELCGIENVGFDTPIYISSEYLKLIKEYNAGEDGHNTYEWNEGIPP